VRREMLWDERGSGCDVVGGIRGIAVEYLWSWWRMAIIHGVSGRSMLDGNLEVKSSMATIMLSFGTKACSD
jgi:hypothetical protein